MLIVFERVISQLSDLYRVFRCRWTRRSCSRRDSHFLPMFFDLEQAHFPFGKGIGEFFLPAFVVAGDFFFGEEAVVQHVDEGILVHVASDEDELLPAVAVFALPNSVDVGAVFRPFLFGHGCPEVAGALMATDCSGLGPEASVGEPSC